MGIEALYDPSWEPIRHDGARGNPGALYRLLDWPERELRRLSREVGIAAMIGLWPRRLSDSETAERAVDRMIGRKVAWALYLGLKMWTEGDLPGMDALRKQHWDDLDSRREAATRDWSAWQAAHTEYVERARVDIANWSLRAMADIAEKKRKEIDKRKAKQRAGGAHSRLGGNRGESRYDLDPDRLRQFANKAVYRFEQEARLVNRAFVVARESVRRAS